LHGHGKDDLIGSQFSLHDVDRLRCTTPWIQALSGDQGDVIGVNACGLVLTGGGAGDDQQMDRQTAAIIKRRVQKKSSAPDMADNASVTERIAATGLKSIQGIRGELRHGIVHELDHGPVRLAIDTHGLRTSAKVLIVPVGLAYWAMRHAQVDRPGSCPILLIRERDLSTARLLSSSATFTTQLPNSKYLKVADRWNRSRSNRWCFEYDTVDATSDHHIGFIPLDAEVEKALAAVGAKVNVGLRRMTVVP
jgi:hypothetical protein